MSSVCIIGGGISGLSAAYSLIKQGHQVTLFEASDDIGGVLQSASIDGYLCELGPNTLYLRYPEIKAFFEEVGLDKLYELPNGNEKYRFIVKDGCIAELPASVLGLIRSRAFSLKAKFRLLGEIFVGRGKKEESLAEFAIRRFGKEFFEYGFDPFVSGVHAGNPWDLSVKYGFPMLYGLEREYGSVIRGIMRSKRIGFKKETLSFKGGMHTLALGIADKIRSHIRVNSSIESIAIRDKGWIINDSEYYDNLVIAVPANKMLGLPLPRDILGRLGFVSGIRYNPVSVVYLGYDNRRIGAGVEGFGFLVPSREKRRILGATMTSNVFSGRAPAGKTLFSVFFGSSGLTEAEYKGIAREEIGELFKIEGLEEFSYFKSWPTAIPQYGLGYGKILEGFDEIERDVGNMRFVGNYRGGISLNDAILSGINIRLGR